MKKRGPEKGTRGVKMVILKILRNPEAIGAQFFKFQIFGDFLQIIRSGVHVIFNEFHC